MHILANSGYSLRFAILFNRTPRSSLKEQYPYDLVNGRVDSGIWPNPGAAPSGKSHYRGSSRGDDDQQVQTKKELHRQREPLLT